jgi:lipoate-protein ligase A
VLLPDYNTPVSDTWRLLITPPARSAWNMAVDEAVPEHIGRGESLPTLRLYAWDPPCLSRRRVRPPLVNVSREAEEQLAAEMQLLA